MISGPQAPVLEKTSGSEGLRLAARRLVDDLQDRSGRSNLSGGLVTAARPARRNNTAHTSHGTLLGVTFLHSVSCYTEPLNGFSTPENRIAAAGAAPAGGRVPAAM
jgi:hypothetical protein